MKSNKKNDWVIGIHPVKTLLQHNPKRIETLFFDIKKQDRRLKNLLCDAEKSHVSIQKIDKHQFESMLGNANHQGVAAYAKLPTPGKERDLEILLEKLPVPAFLLVLDGITDPHNFGACLRSADAAGVHAVIIPQDKAVGLTPTVYKVASGAAENVTLIQVTNLARTLRHLKHHHNIFVYGLSDKAKNSFYQTNLTGPIALVMGEEGKGIRRLTNELCDNLLYLPMQGIVESLNVSVATGICLYEALRQRKAIS